MILDQIVEYKKQELEETKLKLSLNEIKSRLKDCKNPLDFLELHKSRNGIKIISEIKKASPSKGVIREDFDHLAIAKQYMDWGAFAISILTDKKFFQGDIEFLSDISKISNIPLLRKDFTIDPYHIYEARYYGADLVLLIVAALSKYEIEEFIQLAKSLGMRSIVEVHTESELQTAIDAGSEIIGINNRDLKTFKVDLDISLNLSKLVPEGTVLIAESGISSRKDIDKLFLNAGIDTFLIGETLMKDENPGEKLKSLIDD